MSLQWRCCHQPYTWDGADDAIAKKNGTSTEWEKESKVLGHEEFRVTLPFLKKSHLRCMFFAAGHYADVASNFSLRSLSMRSYTGFPFCKEKLPLYPVSLRILNASFTSAFHVASFTKLRFPFACRLGFFLDFFSFRMGESKPETSSPTCPELENGIWNGWRSAVKSTQHHEFHQLYESCPRILGRNPVYARHIFWRRAK